jgi:methylmalonyl-CoA mutase, N-terminal domain
VVVGVNSYRVDENPQQALLRVDPSVGDSQVAKLAGIRAARDGGSVQSSLAALETSALSGANLMPPIIDCVRCYSTLGEICGVLRKVFGEYRPSTFL